MNLTFNFRNFTFFSIAFILFTAIGTVSHELGHIAIAKILGYDTKLYFDSMSYNFSDQTSKWESFLITLGGPAQTMTTGILGLGILQYRNKKNHDRLFDLLDWFCIFLSLFWLREVFNLIMSIMSATINPEGSFFSGDEAGLALLLDLPSGTFAILFAGIGLFIGMYIIFKVIHKKDRFTFILSGLVGGIVGFILWMNVVGPLIIN